MNDLEEPKHYSPGVISRMKHLTPWKKGESGNPNVYGRGATGVISAAYDAILVMPVPPEMCVGQFSKFKNIEGLTFCDLLAFANVLRAIYSPKGAVAAKEITDRTEGKVPLRIAGYDGGPIAVTLSDDERDRELSRLMDSATIDAEYIDVPAVPTLKASDDMPELQGDK